MVELSRPCEPGAMSGPDRPPPPAGIVRPRIPEDEISYGYSDVSRIVAPPWAHRDLDDATPDETPSEEFWPLRPVFFRPGPVPAGTGGPSRAAATTARPDVAAAQDTQIVVLPRMLAGEAVRAAALEVESRPTRTYRRCLPRSSQADEVRPEYHGVAVLRAAAHAHGRLRTRGLGLLFPPHTVHARNSTSAGTGDSCELIPVDHVHIRQAVVARDDPLRSPLIKAIVARARPGQDSAAVTRQLCEALREVEPGGTGPARTDSPVRAECVTAVHDADSVQLGDHALITLDPRYVVERTTVPAGALLAGREDLARRYVDLAAGRREDPAALASFLADLVGAAGNSTGDNVLGCTDGLAGQQATVLGLFGLVPVDHATGVRVRIGTDRAEPVMPL